MNIRDGHNLCSDRRQDSGFLGHGNVLGLGGVCVCARGPRLITRHTALRVCAGRSSSVGIISHFFLQGQHLFPDAGSRGHPAPGVTREGPSLFAGQTPAPSPLQQFFECPWESLTGPQPCPSRPPRWPPEGAVDMPISGIYIHLLSLHNSYNFPPRCPESSTGAAAQGRHSRHKCLTLKRNIGRRAEAWGDATGGAQDAPPPNVPLWQKNGAEGI